mmetsp:Transcript_55855/g.167402  ORF Transcript_55855/g.167402 Transcript_55855/m.167402 type:complete len:170 (-) Transcript_55855:581-1090(-)
MKTKSSCISNIGESPYEWYKGCGNHKMDVDNKGDFQIKAGMGLRGTVNDEGSIGMATTDSEGSDWCPLFMTSLPRDFESHSGLAAIASLLEEEDDNASTKKDTAKREEELRLIAAPVFGGGKCARDKKSKILRSRYRPYVGADNGKRGRTQGRQTTMGEAQLFLQMWKI